MLFSYLDILCFYSYPQYVMLLDIPVYCNLYCGFVLIQATVHLLRTEGVQLNDMPIPPVDKSKRPKGYVAKKPEEDPDWIEYW